MTTADIRAKKMRELVDSQGLTRLCEASGRSKSQFSDIKNGRRHMGEKLARALEKELQLPSGYFDQDNENLAIQQYQNRVPLVSWEFLLGETLDPLEVLMTNTQTSGAGFALRLQDTSMEPLIGKGDDIIVDPGIKPQPTDIAVAVADGRYVIGKYRAKSKSSFELAPINADFAPVSSNESAIEIKGVVVEIRKFLRH